MTFNVALVITSEIGLRLRFMIIIFYILFYAIFSRLIAFVSFNLEYQYNKINPL
jgi:hypothetical protein